MREYPNKQVEEKKKAKLRQSRAWPRAWPKAGQGVVTFKSQQWKDATKNMGIWK